MQRRLHGEVCHEQLLWHRPGCKDLIGVQQQKRRAPGKMQVRPSFLCLIFCFITLSCESNTLFLKAFPECSESLFLFYRSRTKNMMWYGVLGTKELLQRTYKNLEQKVQLEVKLNKHQITHSSISSHCDQSALLFSLF